MKNDILKLMFLVFCSLCFSQQDITWEDLSKVAYTNKYFAIYDDFFLYPKFSDSVKDLEGKRITVKGYFLNISSEENLYILSKGPMSACFFCGQGGPETAVELQFKNRPNFKTDNIVAITGVLTLNKADVEHFNYILKNCKGVLIN
jgi:hypothetical protein